MNDLPREARWSLIAAIVLGLFLAGLGAGAVIGSGSHASAPATSTTVLTRVQAATDADAFNVKQTGNGTGVRSDSTGGSAAYFTSQGSNGTVSITASGASYGVYAENDGANNASGGAVSAQGKQNDGVVATTDSAQAAAIRAQNGSTNGVAIWGSNPGTGIGVFGVADGSAGSQGTIAGVAGQTGTVNGIGVYGAAPFPGQAGYFAGSATVTRDLQVGGAVVGYSAIVAINGSSATLYRGVPVSLTGVRTTADGSIVPVVGPAQVGQLVVGIADRRATTSAIQVPSATRASDGALIATSSGASALAASDWVVEPEDSLLVGIGGQFPTVTVSAAHGPITVGTPLVVDGGLPGQLVKAGRSPSAGTVVGYALGSLASGVGTVPILIEIH